MLVVTLARARIIVDLVFTRIGTFALVIVLGIAAKFPESELVLVLLLSVNGTRRGGLRDITRVLLGRW
jgi:hypothetical protein